MGEINEILVKILGLTLSHKKKEKNIQIVFTNKCDRIIIKITKEINFSILLDMILTI